MKDSHIVAFGGDAFYTETTNMLSANFLFALTGKAMPKVCFVPTASGDNPEYIQKFYERYTKEVCEPTHLTLFDREISDLRSFLLSQDIIYVGGGNTANMLAIWRVHGVDEILREAQKQGIVLCGTSAGSLCWFACGVTDSYGRDLSPINDGMGFIQSSNCPHYNSEERRQPQYTKFVREGLMPGFAADDGTALHFINGIFHEAIGSKTNTRAFRVELINGQVIETPLPVRYLG